MEVIKNVDEIEEVVLEPETLVPPSSALEALKKYSNLSADSAMYDVVLPFYPKYVTTNPTLILQAIKEGGEEYKGLLHGIITRYKKGGASDSEKIARAMEEIPVAFGCEMLGEKISGKVSTQVDVRCGTADKFISAAHGILDLYKARGVHSDRILIKVPATVQGILAAKTLESQGIHVNITLCFSLEQAIWAAEVAHASFISPFVGRISDWYRKHGESFEDGSAEDPAVKIVRQAYDYMRANNLSTGILAASIRNMNQVLALIGCDVISVPPNLLQELAKTPGNVIKKKFDRNTLHSPCARFNPNEMEARWKELPKYAQELLETGIQRFADDEAEIETMVRQGIKSAD